MTALDAAYSLDLQVSQPHLRRLLSTLTDEQFLNRSTLLTPGKGSKPLVYALGAKGRDLLATDGYGPKLRSLSYGHLLHALAITRFCIAASQWCWHHPSFALEELRLGYDITASSVIPDAFLRITANDTTEYAVWLEVDNRSESEAKFQQLLRARLIYIKSYQYESYFSTSAVTLAYVVVGGTEEGRYSRLHLLRTWTDQLLAQTKQQEWSSLVRFTTLEYEKLYEQMPLVFSERSWVRADDPTPIALFTH
jgi:hypothetical protein